MFAEPLTEFALFIVVGRTSVLGQAFFKRLAVSEGRAFGRRPQTAKSLIFHAWARGGGGTPAGMFAGSLTAFALTVLVVSLFPR